MAITRKELWAYLQSIMELFNLEEYQKPTDSEVLAFVQWLLPVEEEREDEYRQVFKAILGDDPLWIPCMQCEYDGIFFDYVSEPRPKLIALGNGNSRGKGASQFKVIPGERILVGKCQKCHITEHLHIPVIMHALAKRKKVTGELAIPGYILADADL
jgi:hypothetical protein